MTTWENQGGSWYTSKIGGVAREADRKWYFYPIHGTKRHGPFKTMIEAQKEADKINKRSTAAA